MRKIIYAQMVSLDGFVEGPNGELEWSTPGAELHQHFNDQYLTGAIDTALYGRRMYENMAAYWPAIDPNGSAAEVEIEFARAWRKLPKIVFSTTLERVKWNSILAREVVPEEIEALKTQDGGDIDLGGADLAATFIRLGLVDEYRLYVHPVVLGSGTPMFPPGERLDLQLTQTRTFPCGVVLLRYLVAHAT